MGPAHRDGAWGRRAQAVFDAALDGVICADEDGRVLAANAAAATLLSARPGERLPDALALDVARARSGALRVERELAGLLVEVSVIASDLDGRRVTTLFVRDRTSARRAERLREVEHRLARLLVSAGTGADIAREALQLVATGLGFDHAELWLADPQAATLRLAAAWRREPGSAFAEAARHIVLGRGEDLAGQAWEIGETVCWDDARLLEGLVRGREILDEGIRGCAALPVSAAGRLAGVGVFARSAAAPLDPELRQTLHAVGVQIRHFAERRAAERRLAEETVALAAVARAGRRLTSATDARAVREAICETALQVASATSAFLALPDPEHGGLIVRCGEAPPDADAPMLRAFEGRRTVHLGETADTASGVVEPIVDDDSALGVLGVGWDTRRATVDRSTRLLVRLLAGEAALALKRADLVARLEAAARTDPLTGLVNVRGWEEHLERELAAAARDGRPVAVALLDLDDFKSVNDRLGHQGGDLVLRASAAAWRTHLRNGDVLARLGGDEFAALLPGCRPDDALTLADRLRASTEQATTCVGIAYWDGEEPPDRLMMRADAALYAAKAQGRDRVATG